MPKIILDPLIHPETIDSLKINHYFPFSETNAEGFQEYFSCKPGEEPYAGLEFLINMPKSKNGYELFTWGSNPEIQKLIANFQSHYLRITGHNITCNNY